MAFCSIKLLNSFDTLNYGIDKACDKCQKKIYIKILLSRTFVANRHENGLEIGYGKRIELDDTDIRSFWRQFGRTNIHQRNGVVYSVLVPRRSFDEWSELDWIAGGERQVTRPRECINEANSVHTIYEDCKYPPT